MDLRKKLGRFGVIPVIGIHNVGDAVPLARALMDGGLSVAEITFRTAAAADAIREIKQAVPQMLVGAGTILSQEQLENAQAAGADFMVAPGLNVNIVEKSLAMGMPFIPGCVTASEIELALQIGLDFVKFFPAEAMQARAVIKAFSGPYPNMYYMPTGGIGLENLESYLKTANVACCGGSWIAPQALIGAGKFTEIKENAKATVTLIERIRKGSEK